jgi:hypothetical protein
LEQLNRKTIAEGFEKYADQLFKTANQYHTLVQREVNSTTERIDKLSEVELNGQKSTEK